MFTLHTDIYFSRRLRMHHVVDEADDPVWSGKDVVGALDWLFENEHKEFRLESGPEDLAYIVTIRRA